MLTSARNVSLLRQFTYMYLEILITLFQKMIWFIGVWATVQELLAIKISKKMPAQQKFNKIILKPVEMKNILGGGGEVGGLPVLKYCRPPLLANEKNFPFQVVYNS